MGALADHNARVACTRGGSVLLQVTGNPRKLIVAPINKLYIHGLVIP